MNKIDKYKATISCMLDGCDWKMEHDGQTDGVPDWTNYAQILRDHNILRHKNFEIIDNSEEIKEKNNI